jgi:predicted HTH transcriptional regulator
MEAMIRQNESQEWERKRSLAERRKGLEALCGMVNAETAHGAVGFGIGPDGSLVGVEPGDLDRAQQSMLQTVRDKFDPPLHCSVLVVEDSARCFVVVEARRNRDVPYHEFDGRAWIREGTTTRQLTASEKRSLQRMRNRDLHNGPWRCDRCGSIVGMLVSMEFGENGARKTYDCQCGGEFWPAA